MESLKYYDSYIPVVDGKVICTMANGGPIRRATRLQAEEYSRQYQAGYRGGSFLGSIDDILNEEYIEYMD